MNNKLRVTLIVLLSAVFAGSAGVIISRSIQYKQGEETYNKAEQLVSMPNLSSLPRTASQAPVSSGSSSAVYIDPYANILRRMDFTSLRKVNSDVVGWIVIPNTIISYPLMQGKDNDFYLHYTWNKEQSAVGAIFLEYRNKRDLSDFNTIVYGHHMNNGSMFAALRFYKDKSYWQAHPAVYLTDDSGSHKYNIFAAYEVNTQGDTYKLGFSGQAAKLNYIQYCRNHSAISTGIVPTASDKILTMSTCIGYGHATRWVVQAVLSGSEPSAKAEKAVSSSASLASR